MAGVLRHLGVAQNGGAHAHLRRRIDGLGIDTTHFLGRAHYRGVPSPRRLSPEHILVVRPEGARRQATTALRRALKAEGRAYRCQACGVADQWNGRPLTLHVDHVNGQFLDCRETNLRFLCPNCHSQTPTHAGRNRRRGAVALVRVDANGNTIEELTSPTPRTEAQKVAILAEVERKKLTVSDAARLIGCSRSYVYVLRRRLQTRPSPADELSDTASYDSTV